MSDVRCPVCGAASATTGSRFCHQCGTVFDTQEPPPTTERPGPPEPPAPPDATAGHSNATRLLGPAVAGVAGIALVVAGIVGVGSVDDAPDLSGALRAAGVLETPVAEDALPGTPSGSTIAGLVSDHNPAPTTTTTTTTTTTDPGLEDWQVALSEPFDTNERAWPIGELDRVTRSLVDGRYRMAVTTADNAVAAYTWRSGITPTGEYILSMDVIRSTANAAACGPTIAAEADYPRVSFLVDDLNHRFRVGTRRAAGADADYLIDWTDSSLIQSGETNRLILLSQDDGIWVFINDTAVARVVPPGFVTGQIGMALWGPGGGETSACDLDNLEVRWP